jgi:LmbE family N-acetylglucosaminyl deacetylase
MRNILLIFFLILPYFSYSNKNSSEIYVNLEKLYSLKKVLYIAAHPDDENTRALSWFSLQHKAETAYLSLTRGDGGQNLIGNELSARLGVLRTQELLAARSFDGASQFFTRAVDFGYSKSAKESFEIWGKADILADVVLIIRQFKPDVIITRFPPDKRAGHGHHTASALIAIEAFEKAADSTYLPNQVKKHGIWQTTSLYWNTSVWWDETLSDSAKNNSDYLIKDIGTYNSLLGKSYNEIGTKARSQHKCQGFGGIIERGSRTEYFKHLKGIKLKESFFENNTDSWTSISNENTEANFNSLLSNFDFINTQNNINQLIEIRKAIELLPESIFKHNKLKNCDALIFNCLGLFMEVTSNDYSFTSGKEIELNLNLINRSTKNIELISINKIGDNPILLNKKLPHNEIFTEVISLKLIHLISTPYWLNLPFNGLFNVSDSANIGLAENRPITQSITIKINNINITTEIPLTYKWRDPSYGERRRSLISTPNFTANFEQKIIINKIKQEQIVKIKVHSFIDNLNDKIQISAPKGWTVSPSEIQIKVDNKHDENWIEFKLKASENSERGKLTLSDESGNSLYSFTEIKYDHIPAQVIFQESELICVKLDAKIKPGKIAYISAVDDKMPSAIEQLGFLVDILRVKDLSHTDLSQYQSVILGIRIYNINPELSNFNQKLEKYVSNGGNLVMQYNTASRSSPNKKYGVLPFEISRNRVTDENAAVTFMAPKHNIMNYPNKITEQDFDGWVQERGLYFANNWSKEYTPLFSWHDENEDAQKGALIVANYGKGQFVYTGISFFRELPMGVEGAYRLFANILSYKLKSD